MSYALLGRRLRNNVLPPVKSSETKTGIGILCHRNTNEGLEFLMISKNGSYKVPVSLSDDLVTSTRDLCGFDVAESDFTKSGYFHSRMNGYKVKVSLYEVNVSHIEEFPDTFSTTAWLSYKDLAKLVPNINWSSVMSLLNKKYDNLVRSPMLSAEEYDAADLYAIQSSSEDITFMPFNMTVGFALPSKHSYPKCFVPQGQSYWNSLCDTIVHDNLSPVSAYVKLFNAMIKENYYKQSTDNNAVAIFRKLLQSALSVIPLDEYKNKTSNVNVEIITEGNYKINVTGDCQLELKASSSYNKELLSVALIESKWKVVNSNTFTKDLLNVGLVTITLTKTKCTIKYQGSFAPFNVELSRVPTEKQYLNKVIAIYKQFVKEYPVLKNRRF